jgi:hypothetical protein
MFTTSGSIPAQMFQRHALGVSHTPRVTESGYGRTVAIVRTLRDGAETRERLQEYLAELVVGMIPFAEPLVASARIAYSELDND